MCQVDDKQWCPMVHAATSGRVEVVSFFLQCDWSENSNQKSISNVSYPTTTKQQAVQHAFVAAAEYGQLQVISFIKEYNEPYQKRCCYRYANFCTNLEMQWLMNHVRLRLKRVSYLIDVLRLL